MFGCEANLIQCGFFFIPSTAAANYNTITRGGGNFQVFLCQLLLLKNRAVFTKNVRKSPESPSYFGQARLFSGCRFRTQRGRGRTGT